MSELERSERLVTEKYNQTKVKYPGFKKLHDQKTLENAK